jgi:hypothetical protein
MRKWEVGPAVALRAGLWRGKMQKSEVGMRKWEVGPAVALKAGLRRGKIAEVVTFRLQSLKA